jgi:hypothetical protein
MEVTRNKAQVARIMVDRDDHVIGVTTDAGNTNHCAAFDREHLFALGCVQIYSLVETNQPLFLTHDRATGAEKPITVLRLQSQRKTADQPSLGFGIEVHRWSDAEPPWVDHGRDHRESVWSLCPWPTGVGLAAVRHEAVVHEPCAAW